VAELWKVNTSKENLSQVRKAQLVPQEVQAATEQSAHRDRKVQPEVQEFKVRKVRSVHKVLQAKTEVTEQMAATVPRAQLEQRVKVTLQAYSAMCTL
jgi:hypothetical protein